MEKREAQRFYHWWRWGEYELRDARDYNLKIKPYICPVFDPGRIRYDIAQTTQRKKGSRKVEENLLVQSLLNIDTANEKSILEFVNRFGLLGLMQFTYNDPMHGPPGYQAPGANGENGEVFFVPKRNGNQFELAERVAEHYLLTQKEFQEYDSRYLMSEPLEDFVEAVNDFQYIGKWIYAINQCIKKDAQGPLLVLTKKEEAYQEIATNGSKDELLDNAFLHVTFLLNREDDGVFRSVVQNETNTSWEIRWGFKSLLDAAYFFLTQDMVSNFWLGQCDRCGKHFMSSVGSQKYCSRKCEDAVRKARSREKEKEGK